MQYITKSQQETIDLGKTIAAEFQGGDIILLEGDLGTGKTTLTKGIAEYFGIKETVTSPTFTLMNIYPIRTKNSELRTLIHIDTYRLEDEKDLIEIGVEDYLGSPDTVCLIEWPEKIEKLIQNKKIIRIKIEHDGENRKILIN